MKPFGLQHFGNFTAFRLNCKISEAQRISLKDVYPDIQIRPIGKGLTRIEGALHYRAYDEFHLHLEIAMADYKADKAVEKLYNLQKAAKRRTEAAHEAAQLPI